MVSSADVNWSVDCWLISTVSAEVTQPEQARQSESVICTASSTTRVCDQPPPPSI
jgi:hypothetical protein